ncbi:MAG: hypothetical protein IT162_03325 [Bryobacterales bacterium]|nr:hypothetical protein [Bryobacterales bacterium]
MGRILSSTQRTPAAASGAPFAFAYTYYLDDALSTITYPSTRTVTNCYDTVGRPVWVSRSGSGATSTVCQAGGVPAEQADAFYGSKAEYAAHGSLRQLRLGNGLWDSTGFNNRQQPATLRLGEAPSTGNVWQQDYTYGVTPDKNNGNITQALLQAPGQSAISTSYSYL